jgi:hypothetical protein
MNLAESMAGACVTLEGEQAREIDDFCAVRIARAAFCSLGTALEHVSPNVARERPDGI